MSKAFVGATIIPVEGDEIRNGVLLIHAGKILEIGESTLNTNNYDIVDCSGKYITPGLIDAHSHVGLHEEGAGSAAADANESTNAITPFLRAIDAIFPEDLGFFDARRGGVTTLGITPGSANLIAGQFAVTKTAGSTINEMVIKTPAGMKFALGENPKRVGKNNQRTPNTRMANAYLIRESLYKALDYKSEWKHYDKLQEFEENKDQNTDKKPVKKPKYNIGLEILGKLLDKEFPVRCHSHRADDILTAIRLADEFDLDIVIDHCTEGHKIANILAERGISTVVGPLMTSRSKRELIQRSLETPGILINAGVEIVCITTDAPVIPIFMLRESMIIALREGNISAQKALECVTINPAKVLKVDDRVGSLKQGKDADFVIWSDDPFDARSKAINTYINGKLVYERENNT